MALTEEQKSQLEKFREARAAKDQAEQDATELREFERESLVAELEKTLGKENVDFKIIDNPFGLFAIRKPDLKAIRNWEQAPEAKRTNLEWAISLLRHYIAPESKSIEWCQIGGNGRPMLIWHTANAFVELMGLDKTAAGKK
jgi:hypothetical protein